MSKSRAFFNFLGLLMFISAIVLLNESIVITEPYLQLTLEKYIFIGGAFLLFVVFIFMWVFTKHRELINYATFIFLALAFITPIVATILQPSLISFVATNSAGVSSTVSLTLGMFAKFQSIFLGLTSLLVTYLFIAVVPKLIKSKAFIMGFLYLLILVLLSLIVYSVITEWDQYYFLFTTGDIDYYSPTISLFSNTNVFGYYLSLGIFATGLLDTLKHRFWHYILMLVFILSLLLTITITSYFGAGVFLILFIIYDLKTQFTKHPISSSFWVVSLVTIVVFAIIGFMLSNEPFAISIREDFIPESTESLQSRFIIWQHGQELLFGRHFIIGHGFGIANSLLQVAMGVEGAALSTNRFHQGWMEIIATGGLISLAFYLFGIGYIIFLVVKRQKYNHRLAFTALFILIGILVQSIAEAKVLFKADAMGTLATFLLLIPLLVDEKIIDNRIVTKPLPRTFSLNPLLD